ncbi:MAG: Fe-S cluster assembly scaffold IscU [Acidobacteria bacterium]|mgnify:CR=1 FL=1|nr:Fe-S cluster assembly scaffold IscU [Acidobacteriota bacterium]
MPAAIPRSRGGCPVGERATGASAVAERFRETQHAGSLPAGATDVGTGRAEAPRHGDVTRLQLRIDAATGIIREARFKAFGCSFAIASADLTADRVTGRTLASALDVTADEVAAALDLPAAKQYCAELAHDALRAAVADYETKHSAQITK